MKILFIIYLVSLSWYLHGESIVTDQKVDVREIDLYKLQEKMRIINKYCSHIYRLKFKLSKKKETKTPLKTIRLQIKRFYQDQADLFALNPMILESNYLIEKKSFSELNKSCMVKVKGVERDLKVVESLKSIILLCLSSDYLEDSDNTALIKRELIEKVEIFIGNLIIIEENLDGYTLDEINYPLWGYNFNKTYSKCKVEYRDAIHEKAPELHDERFH